MRKNTELVLDLEWAIYQSDTTEPFYTIVDFVRGIDWFLKEKNRHE